MGAKSSDDGVDCVTCLGAFVRWFLLHLSMFPGDVGFLTHGFFSSI